MAMEQWLQVNDNCGLLSAFCLPAQRGPVPVALLCITYAPLTDVAGTANCLTVARWQRWRGLGRQEASPEAHPSAMGKATPRGEEMGKNGSIAKALGLPASRLRIAPAPEPAQHVVGAPVVGLCADTEAVVAQVLQAHGPWLLNKVPGEHDVFAGPFLFNNAGPPM